MVIYQKILKTIILFLVSTPLLAQETPEDLGKMVFTIFKNQDIETLKGLTPTANEALDFYTKLDSTVFFGKEDDFKRKYSSRDSMFKEKCIAIMMGKAGVDFKSAILEEVKYFEKPLGQTSTGNALTKTYIEICFLSEKKKYSLLFRGIHKFGGIWKLGESVRIKKEGEEE
jgi:hypothetical protein